MTRKPVVLGGSRNPRLAGKIAQLIGGELGEIEVSRFPDGELYIRLKSSVEGRPVIYVNSLCRDPNESIVETLYTLDLIGDLGAEEIHAVIPYMAYARQDSRFKPGEAISIKSLAKLFKTFKVDYIYTVDMHLHRIEDPSSIFGSSFKNVTGVRELAKYVKNNHNMENLVVIGPDEESEQWAEIMSEELGGLEYFVLEKVRLGPDTVEVEARGVDVRGKNVVVVDDIISTGGTILKCVENLRKLGAGKVIVTCVHPVLVAGAYEKLSKLNLEDLVGTDTIPSRISKVSVAPPIASAIKENLSSY